MTDNARVKLDALVQSTNNIGLLDHQARTGGDVHGAVGANRRVLTPRAAHGESEGLAHRLGLGLGAVRGQVGKLQVKGGAHAGAKVGRAAGHVSVVSGVSENAGVLLNHIARALQAVEDVVQHGTLLHAHDAKVVLLAHPHDEAAVLGDIAPTAVGPVGADAGGLQVGIGGHVLEHKVLLNQLVVLGVRDGLGDAGCKGVVAASVGRVRHQVLECLKHLLLELNAVLLAHRTGQREVLQVAANAHAHGGVSKAELGQVQPANEKIYSHLSIRGPLN
eukprot:1178354-Prorocentrum_minimum.AAC.2